MSVVTGIKRRLQAINPFVEVRPNFFIVGAGKSGTTFLHWQLAKHPDIFMSDPKEPNYLAFKDVDLDSLGQNDLKYVQSSVLELSEYRALFDRAIEKVVGESSPVYLMHEDAARNIFDFSPTAKILIILRNPVDVLFSSWKHLCRLGYESRSLELSISSYDPKNRFSTGHYLAKVDYANQVGRYMQYFDTLDVKVSFFEELVEDPGRYLITVLSWLGVNAGFDFGDLAPMNADHSGSNLAQRDKELLLAKVTNIIEETERALEVSLAHWKL